jgi:hypothetical protein
MASVFPAMPPVREPYRFSARQCLTVLDGVDGFEGLREWWWPVVLARDVSARRQYLTSSVPSQGR